MQCPQCQTENREGSRFCAECGASLTSACPDCGFANYPDAKFCSGCGRALSATTTSSTDSAVKHEAPEAERRQLTVMFCDLVGSTALAERLDPEELRELLAQYQDTCADVIQRYEGHIARYVGDGLLVYFGYPQAHEDDPQRAVHTGLGIVTAIKDLDAKFINPGVDLAVRIGIATGLVVAGDIGNGERREEKAVVGETPNIAARLQALAEPNTVLIGASTQRLVEGLFDCDDLGEQRLKGISKPLGAYRVRAESGVPSRFEAKAARGLTPLIGREHELVLLRDVFAAAQLGQGQAVFVTGEAGIGKSRLVLEFRRDAEAAGARWIVGHSVSYGHAIAHLPVLDFVRDLLGIKEGDNVETVVNKLGNGAREAGDDVACTVPFLRSLLSPDLSDPQIKTMNPVQREGRIAEAVRDLLLAHAQERPLVVVVEDLHWIDPHSEDILRLLLEGMAAAPLMVVLTYRPGYAQTFGEQTDYFTQITLRALPEAQAASLVRRVLQAAVPPEVNQLVARQAEGNPLFVEELTKSLVEDGTLQRADGGYRLTRPLDNTRIPGTIQGVIMARIDRLPKGSKTALQIASVIGREFTARLVERVAGLERDARQALEKLRSVELIFEKARSPELAYMFKHALTHDVAYETLLRQKRRELHRRTGQIIEELHADRLPEFYETLAFHYRHGESWGKAADYLLKSAVKARASFDYPEGGRLCAAAIEALCRTGGEPGELIRAHEMLGDFESLQGRLEPANQACEAALALTVDSSGRRRLANKLHHPGTVVREGGKVVYYEHGGGEPTLVLCHPAVYGLATFQPLLEQLCQDFRIVTWDPRGTGSSDPLPGPYYTRDFAADLCAVVEAIGNRPVVIVGNSRGAAVGVHFATSYPHLVEKLVLAGLSPGGVLRADVPYADRRDADYLRRHQAALKASDWPALVRNFNAQVCAGEPGCQKLVERFTQLWSRIPLETLKNVFMLDDPGRDIRALLPALGVPALVLHGEADRLIPVQMARWVAEQIPGAQFYALKGRSHALVATATVEFAEMVRRFVRTGRPT